MDCVAPPAQMAATSGRSWTRRSGPGFGETVATAPHAIQWLSDNGPQYTATASVLDAHDLGLVPITVRGV